MSSEFIAFTSPAGFTLLPPDAIVYLDGEAATARSVQPGERCRVVVGGVVVEVVKLYLDTVTTALS